MKLCVLTCAVFPTEADARKKMWIFLKSCEKAGVPKEDLHLYGTGHGFPGYKYMKLDMQLAYLKERLAGNYSHVLYTDGWDAFFTGSLAEVVSKYEAMGSPQMLSSACWQLGNESRMDPYQGCFSETDRYRYPCVGGYLAEVPHIIEMFERMLTLPRQTGDDCFNWYDGWQEGWFRPMLDSKCEIFQVTDDHCVATKTQDLSVRLFNTHTGEEPCILHLSGGYTDQVTGKDAAMIPWAVKLGVIECPHFWARRRDGRACVHCEKVEFGV